MGRSNPAISLNRALKAIDDLLQELRGSWRILADVKVWTDVLKSQKVQMRNALALGEDILERADTYHSWIDTFIKEGEREVDPSLEERVSSKAGGE